MLNTAQIMNEALSRIRVDETGHWSTASIREAIGYAIAAEREACAERAEQKALKGIAPQESVWAEACRSVAQYIRNPAAT